VELAEHQVATDLERLVDLGLINKFNKMTIEELVNSTGEEIVAAIKEAEELDNEEETEKEVLLAADQIRRFLETEDGKLEMVNGKAGSRMLPSQYPIQKHKTSLQPPFHTCSYQHPSNQGRHRISARHWRPPQATSRNLMHLA